MLMTYLRKELLKKNVNENKIVVLVSLIVAQMQVDAIGELIKPKNWLAIKFSQYIVNAETISYSEEIIKECRLYKLKKVDWK